MIKGVDVSEHQGTIDWGKAKGQIDFAVIRSSYGWENYPSQVDEQLNNNVQGCVANGIPFGFYHYSYAANVAEAEKEAEYCISAIKGTNPVYPVFFDVEDKAQQGIRKGQLTNMVAAFCEKIKAAGFKPGVYASKNWWQNHLDYDRLKGYAVWLAHWVEQTDFDQHYDLWQYTSNGAVPGINGRVDLNCCCTEYGTQPAPPAAPTVVTTDNLNQRTQAHTGAEIVQVIPKGTTVEWLADDHWGWSKVQARGKTGWVSNRYLNKAGISDYPTGTCHGTNVNLRQGPSTSYKSLTKLQKGNLFTIVCILPNNWMRVIFNRLEGYIKFDPSYIRYQLNR